MPTIRIHQEHWGKVWRVLVASGPVSRVSQEPVYAVTDRQIRLLRRRKLPFVLVDGTESVSKSKNHTNHA